VYGVASPKGAESVAEVFKEFGLHGFLFLINRLCDVAFKFRMENINDGVDMGRKLLVFVCKSLQNTSSDNTFKFNWGLQQFSSQCHQLGET
jgi:hypothetical protein